MSNVHDHPNTILRREVDEMKRRMEKLEKSINVTEQVMIDMVHKHNSIKDQLIKLTSMLAQIDASKRKKPSKDEADT
jgi:DUF438 domain-containing protein